MSGIDIRLDPEDVTIDEEGRAIRFAWRARIRREVAGHLVPLDAMAREFMGSLAPRKCPHCERESAGLRVAAERGRRIEAARVAGRAASAIAALDLGACREAARGQPKRVRQQVARALERLRRSAARPPSVRRCALDVWHGRSRST